MPLCKKCGLILAASDKVCRGCGTPVEPTAQTPQPPQFPSSSMLESAPLPKLSGLPYSSPLSSAPPPIPSAPPVTPSASPVTPSAPPPSPSFAAPPPIPSTPLSTPAAPPPTPSFGAPPPLPTTGTSGISGTSTPAAPPPVPNTQPAASPAPPPPAAPAPPAEEILKLPTPQQPASQPEEPIRIRPKAFKPGGGSKLPSNLDIDNQPVSGVRRPYQPQQQPPMTQPLNMAQVPPMANPPIKEQPVYRPFTPPTPQPPNSNGSLNTGLGWAVLALFPCCGFNIFAIIAIVLSVIAGGEYKRGEYEIATKHAKTSKTLTIIAVIFAIVIWLIILSIPTDDAKEVNTPDQEQVNLDPIQEKHESDYLNKLATEPIDNLPQSEKEMKIDIQANADPNGQSINESPKNDSIDDEVRSETFIKLYEEISKQYNQNNDAGIDSQPISDKNRQQINSLKNDSIDKEIWREALKKLSVRSKQYNHNNVARTGKNRQPINSLKRDLNQRDKEFWERIRLRIAELQKEDQQNPLRKQIKEQNQKEQLSQD